MNKQPVKRAWFVLVLTLLAGFQAFSAANSSPSPPNILILMTDQQRYDSLGCYGFKAANTPNLDRMAAEGVLFEKTYVTSPVCTPSRASLWTGRHVPGHGVYRLYDDLPRDEILFSKRLKELGYQTALIGKLHVSSIDFEANQRHPNDGFDVFEWCVEACARMESPNHAYARWLKQKSPEFYEKYLRLQRGVGHVPREYHMTEWAAERTLAYLETYDGRKPFLLMMSLFDPHNPYDNYPKEMESLVDASKLPDPLIRSNEFAGKPEDLLRAYKGSYLGDFDKFSREDFRRLRLGYHVGIAYADRAFGRVLEALQKKGLAENTLVIFTSDHGDMLGDHSLFVKGPFFYDPCVRVPLILRWPRQLPAGKRIGALASSVDIASTVLAAAGMGSSQLGKLMPDSHNLLPLARGEVASAREDAVCVYRNTGLSTEPDNTPYWNPPIHATMLRHANWKLNAWHDAAGRGRGLQGELYDMDADPQELRNLWADPAHLKIRDQLTGRLMDWLLQQELQRGSRGGGTPPAQKMKNSIK